MSLERTQTGVWVTHFEVPADYLDQYRHVNYKRYAEIAEIGQDEYLASRGLSFDKLEKWFNLRSFVVWFEQVNYSQLYLGDKLELLTRVGKIGNSSMDFEQTAFKDKEHIFDFNLKVVVVDVAGKPVRVPNYIRDQVLIV